jgi:hypothetical protein
MAGFQSYDTSGEIAVLQRRITTDALRLNETLWQYPALLSAVYTDISSPFMIPLILAKESYLIFQQPDSQRLDFMYSTFSL